MEGHFVGEGVVGGEEEVPVGGWREMVCEEREQTISLIIGQWGRVGCVADYDVAVSRQADFVETRAIIFEEANEVVEAREFAKTMGVEPLFAYRFRFQDF